MYLTPLYLPPECQQIRGRCKAGKDSHPGFVGKRVSFQKLVKPFGKRFRIRCSELCYKPDTVLRPVRYRIKLDNRVRQVDLSLIHISEPTRRTPISYAVF